MEEPILNTHNKAEYEPAHTAEQKTFDKYFVVQNGCTTTPYLCNEK